MRLDSCYSVKVLLRNGLGAGVSIINDSVSPDLVSVCATAVTCQMSSPSSLLSQSGMPSLLGTEIKSPVCTSLFSGSFPPRETVA